MAEDAHQTLRFWVRPAPGAEPVERGELSIETGRGVVGDHTLDGKRHLTLLFAEDWARATAGLGVELDPARRRANVLVSGGGGARWLDSRVRIGEIELAIEGIVQPCAIMDRVRIGLKAGLSPEGRGGIWGRVLRGGTLRIGDRIEPLPGNPESRR